MNWPDGWTIPGEWKGVRYDVPPRYHRAADGLAGRAHDRGGVDIVQGGEASYHQRDRVYGDASPSLDANARKGAPLVAFVKAGRAQSAEDAESWREGDVMPTLNAFDVGDVRTTAVVLGVSENQRGELLLTEQAHQLTAGGGKPGQGYSAVLGQGGVTTADDPLLPLGLDSHRYRCCGNGVVSSVAEWIGVRLAEEMEEER